MMYQKQIYNEKLLVRAQWFFIAILSVVIVLLWNGWKSAPKELSFHVPPNIPVEGAVFKAGEVPEPNIYSFAYFFYQQLYRWRENGQSDYGQNVYRLSAFLTPRCRDYLDRDVVNRGRSGELANRTRSVQLLVPGGYQPSLVEEVGPGRWNVLLDVEISEWIDSVQIKNTLMRSTIPVVSYDIDKQMNPWGLGIDCHAQQQSYRLTDQQVEALMKGEMIH